MNQTNTIARAFELARGGECRSVDEIRKRLSAERFEAVHMHLSGSVITRQLKEAIAACAAVETTSS